MTNQRLSRLLPLLLLSGCTVSVAVQDPHPNVLAKGQLPARVLINVAQVPDRVCGSYGPVTLCAERFKEKLTRGLVELTSKFAPPAGTGGDRLKSDFKVVEFTFGPGQAKDTGRIFLRFQYELKDPSGKPLVQVADLVIGPREFQHGAGVQEAVTSTLDAALDRIGAAINQAPIWDHSATASQ
jgi:hypothetical protein